MKIEKVIKIFKKLIPHYKLNSNVCNDDRLGNGICYAAKRIYSDKSYYEIMSIFRHDGYYNSFISENGYLFEVLNFDDTTPNKAIKPRLEFLKKEVISLQKLLDKGYTDI